MPINVVRPSLPVLRPVHGALLLPLLHELLVLAELAAVRGALLLLKRVDQAFFLLVLSKGVIEVTFLRNLEPDQVRILHSLLVRTNVLALDRARIDGAAHRRCLLRVLIELFLHSAQFEASHGLRFKGICRRALDFLNRQLELVKEA